VIREVGAEALPRYAASESGHIGLACVAPEAPDEVHLLHDRLAVVQPGKVGPLTSAALLFTTLRPKAGLVLLNVSLGDVAMLARRVCGCPLERLGWTTHLHSIRSLEKLTAGGMTFLDADVIRLLEEELPARSRAELWPRRSWTASAVGPARRV
jgi:hypothetical protein